MKKFNINKMIDEKFAKDYNIVLYERRRIPNEEVEQRIIEDLMMGYEGYYDENNNPVKIDDEGVYVEIKL